MFRNVLVLGGTGFVGQALCEALVERSGGAGMRIAVPTRQLAHGKNVQFLPTVEVVEANIHDEYKRRLVAASGTDTTLSAIFGPHHPHFNPMRVIKNRVVVEYQDRLDEVPHNTENEPVIGQMELLGQHMTLRKFSNLVPMPGTTGDFEEMPLLSGQGVGLVRSIEPAGAVVENMAKEAAAILGRLAS